ncbi:undecaprenyl-phosphate glucose phosphotransferase [Marinospirillum minutulum]|uniref:undecaprenyl-phosphate glucose phosphotransferase n=1 Tax=Marinospirillum minutulum TaxID=64974 RepID=UPI000404B16F|nr:undecaprenyl-phosphate glucose phosphotransferase [Marinospirillum minutulum]
MSGSKRFITERYPVQYFVALFDLALVALSGWLVHWLRFDDPVFHERYIWAISVMSLLVVVLNTANQGYSRWRTTQLMQMMGRLAFVWLMVGLICGTLIFFADASERYSRLWIGTTLLSSFIAVVLLRVLILLLLLSYRARGKNRRHVFLVGPGQNLLKIARQMRKHQEEGFSIAGVHRFDEAPDQALLELIRDRVAASNAKEVWICLPLDMGRVVRSLMYTLRNETAEVRFLPEMKDIPLLNHRVSEVAGMYAIDLSVTPMTGFARVLKRLEDIIVGGAISLMILPVCVSIAVAIKVTSPGPVLFKQYRTGINGKRFRVYKFRSMKVHQEKAGQVTQATKGDSRITPIGGFLRRTSLDELPQFYNVLQGRMSIVGPRPHALAHNEHYKDLVESYMRRHKVKPGITGWAQVSGYRGETDTLDKMQKRVEYDLWYIDNWSLLLDIKIIFLTVFKGFINKNAY